jgi:hypothetical protein
MVMCRSRSNSGQEFKDELEPRFALVDVCIRCFTDMAASRYNRSARHPLKLDKLFPHIDSSKKR